MALTSEIRSRYVMSKSFVPSGFLRYSCCLACSSSSGVRFWMPAAFFKALNASRGPVIKRERSNSTAHRSVSNGRVCFESRELRCFEKTTMAVKVQTSYRPQRQRARSGGWNGALIELQLGCRVGESCEFWLDSSEFSHVCSFRVRPGAGSPTVPTSRILGVGEAKSRRGT